MHAGSTQCLHAHPLPQGVLLSACRGKEVVLNWEEFCFWPPKSSLLLGKKQPKEPNMHTVPNPGCSHTEQSFPPKNPFSL